MAASHIGGQGDDLPFHHLTTMQPEPLAVDVLNCDTIAREARSLDDYKCTAAVSGADVKTWLFLLAIVSAALIWFRTGRRWGSQRRGNTIALFVFLLMLGGMVAMVILAVKLF